MNDQFRYYPSQIKTGALHDDFRLLFNGQYEIQDRMEKLTQQLKEKHGAEKGGGNGADAGSPSHTKIGGLYMKGVPPAHGQSPFYNAATGQYEPQTPAGAVPPPATNSSPGTAGAMAFDGTHVYVCVAANTWLRATLSTF